MDEQTEAEGDGWGGKVGSNATLRGPTKAMLPAMNNPESPQRGQAHGWRVQDHARVQISRVEPWNISPHFMGGP